MREPKPIPGWSAYLIYPDGRVWSLRARRFMKTCLNPRGYVHVVLHMDGRHRSTTVHRLVAETFLGVVPGVPVNHIDGVKTNNDVSNLEATTHRDNCAHATRLGLWAVGERNSLAKLSRDQVVEIRKLAASGVPKKHIARRLGITPKNVRLIVSRATWRHVA